MSAISIHFPSFVIAGATSRAITSPRWDLVNSRELIQEARSVYFNFLTSNSNGPEPTGVVLNEQNGGGSVVFERPILLPEEHYISLDLLRSRPARSRQARERNKSIP